MKDESDNYLNHIKELEFENTILKEKLEFHELFMENSNSWETFRNKAGKIIYISPNFEQITGYDRNDYLTEKSILLILLFPMIGSLLLKTSKNKLIKITYQISFAGYLIKTDL